MSKVISSINGTRTEPMDSLIFVRGSTATFKMIFTSNGVPTKVDTGTNPSIKIFAPASLAGSGIPVPTLLAEVEGTLTSGQEFEYSFTWDVPVNQTPIDDYIVSYYGTVAGTYLNFGDEYFTISGSAGTVGIKAPTYATVTDVRLTKNNIDDYIPKALRKDLTARNDYIEVQLGRATTKLREELSLFKARGHSENYKLFTIFYTVWLILLAARGEDGSSVSDQNLNFWKAEWKSILAQEKREGGFQGLPLGRG